MPMLYKERAWYSTRFKPDRTINLIVETESGNYFEATYEANGWHLAKVRGGRVIFPLYRNQAEIKRWMKV